MATYRNYIGGEWVESQSDRSIPNINPANLTQSWGDVPLSTEGEMKAAIASAHEAFKTWRRVPAPKRAQIVFDAWRIMGERKEKIGRLLTQEEGKILPESLGEVQKTLNILEYQAGEGRRLSGYSRESEMPRNYAYTRREPLGVVALITPWNFPVAIPAWKIAPAIIAGNTVVLKPSELTPATAEEVVKCFVDAGAPRGVINLVHGLGSEVGEVLINAPEVQAVSFTGSNAVGHHIYASAAKRGVRVQCEMGGKNPIIVLEDANLPLAIAATAKGAFGSTGQRCTATSRAIVQESIADRFVEGVLEQLHQITAGDPMDEGTSMGPSVSEAQLTKVLEYMEIGKGEAELKAGGYRLTEGDQANGLFPAPTLFDHVSPDARIATEEIFGPVLSVIRVKNFDEAMEVANNVEFGLSSSLYTNDYAKVMRYAEEAETG
ncbi:MAG TPA: aldehyde dehydrogenase family protein, partial [Myxococcales bacterium]|nr:aldehyde dehydrogenase family protein [Myxococcales bacterium]